MATQEKSGALAPKDKLDGWIAGGDVERSQAALDRVPSDERGALWWRRHAECLMIGGHWPAAEAAALRGLECLRAQGLDAEGGGEWERLILLRADALRGQGAFTTAEALYLVALRGAPTSAPALSAYALLLVLAGQVERGREILTQAASLHPSHPDVEAADARIRWLCDEALPGDDLNGALILLPHSRAGHTERVKEAASVGDRGAASESWARLRASGATQEALRTLLEGVRPDLHRSSRPLNALNALLLRRPVSLLVLFFLGISLTSAEWGRPDSLTTVGVLLALVALFKVRSALLKWQDAPLPGMELPAPSTAYLRAPSSFDPSELPPWARET